MLAGLVTITAGCDDLYAWMTLLVGILGGFIYCLACRLLVKCKIDDPLEAFPIHGACGIWGVFIIGFCSKSNGVFYGNDATIIGWQIAGILTIMLWSGGWTAIFWLIGKKLKVIRVTPAEEILGMDLVKHSSGLIESEKQRIMNEIEQNLQGGGKTSAKEENQLQVN